MGRTEQSLLDQVRRAAADLMDHSGLPPQRLRVTAGDVTVELEWPTAGAVLAPGPTPTAVPAEEDGDDLTARGRLLTASMVGTFHVAPEPGAAPFVTLGDTVVPGQQVAVLEAMKLMVAVEADVAGTVLEVLVDNGTPVEYGTPLFVLGPARSLVDGPGEGA